MPIKEIERQLDAGGILGNFPRIGKLRKGAEKSEKSAGRDQDHFRMTLEDEHEQAGIVRPAFESLYGTEPRVFTHALIAAPDAKTAFQYAYEAWAHARLLRRCDGDDVLVSWNESIGHYDTAIYACTCDSNKRDCKQTGRLDIVLPELCELTGVWGKFTIETHSIYDIIALAKSMRVAGAILGNMPNVSLEFVPFTIGRAMRKVPVTINGKRSIKPMSLLFAMIEPEFNKQVVTQQLTRPAQLLLAGVNPETGESPAGGLPDIEAEFEQTASWDRDYVMQQTVHLFDHENHQANAIDKMIVDGELLNDMQDDEAIAIIKLNREARNLEKASQNASKSRQKGSNSSAAQQQAQSGADWLKDLKRLNGFIAKAHSELTMNTGAVMEALKVASEPDELENIQDFAGSDLEAWAACVAWKLQYDPIVLADSYSEDSKVRQAAQHIIDARAQRLADVPF